MPALNTETFDQELSILLVSQENHLANLVADHFYKQQISVVKTPTSGLDSSRFVTSLLEKEQFYKMVVILDFDKPFILSSSPNKALIDTILSSEIPKVFLVRVSSKIDATHTLCGEWINQTTQEDKLINYLYQNSHNSKIILGQDVLSASSLLYPTRFFIQSLPNDYLLDPQIEIYPVFEDDFFNSISRELLKPKNKNLLIKGKAISSEEICLKFKLIYQDNYQSDLKIVDLSTRQISRIEKRENLVEVTLGTETSAIIQYLIDNSDKTELGVDPELLSGLIKSQSAFTTSLSKPFKDAGDDFEFELPIHKDNRKLIKPIEPLLANKNENSFNSTDQKPQEKSCLNETQQGQISNSTSYENYLPSSARTQNQIPSHPNELDNQVGKLFDKKRTEQKTTRRTKKVNLLSRIKRKSKNKQVIFLGGIIILLLGLTIGVVFGSLSISFHRSQEIVLKNARLLQNGEFSQINSISFLGWQSRLLDKVFDTQLTSSGKSLSEINKEIIEIADLAQNHQDNSIQIFRAIFSQTSLDTNKSEDRNLQDLLDTQEKTLISFSRQVLSFQTKLEAVNLGSFNSQLQNQLTKTSEEMRSLSNKLQVFGQINTVLREILALDGKKYYYILLQDNQELRPTGGFIQAIAMLVIEDGRLIDYQVYSTSSIDSKILGTLNPPAEIESLLGESRLFLRDANWNPDFSLSSKQIAWFLRESINQPVDGIIGINYSQVKDILIVLEELKLGQYNEIVTSHNLFSRLEQHAIEEKEEIQENNIHTVILSSLIEAILGFSDQEIAEVTEVFYDSLRNQQSVLFFQDPTINGVMSQLGWTGGLMLPECPARFGDNCSSDHLYQVEANIGINKINQYVSSRVNHSISIKEDNIIHHRQIRYVNKARSNIWPYGSYKAYIRFMVDVDAKLNEITIDGTKVNQDLLKEYVDNGRMTYGLVIDVPPEQERTLTLDFSTPHKVGYGDSYFFFEQSQPGVTNRLSAIALNHPDTLRAELISPLVDVNQNQVVVTSDLGVGFVAIRFASE